MMQTLKLFKSGCISRFFKAGGKVLSCGGGSHCDAMHFAEELTGDVRRENRPGYPAIYLRCSHIHV